MMSHGGDISLERFSWQRGVFLISSAKTKSRFLLVFAEIKRPFIS